MTMPMCMVNLGYGKKNNWKLSFRRKKYKLPHIHCKLKTLDVQQLQWCRQSTMNLLSSLACRYLLLCIQPLGNQKAAGGDVKMKTCGWPSHGLLLNCQKFHNFFFFCKSQKEAHLSHKIYYLCFSPKTLLL